MFCLFFLWGQYAQALSPFLFSQTTLTTERSPIPASTKSTTVTASSSRKEAIVDAQQYVNERNEGQSFSKTRENVRQMSHC